MCGAAVIEGAPFPICKRHAQALFDFLAARAPKRDPTAAERELEWRRQSQLELAERAAARSAVAKAQSVVYYVRIHDHIKIGFTTNVKERMNQLRVPTSSVLATEPGGRSLEGRRHKLFAAERIGKREDFVPSESLLQWIDEIRAINGDPNITTWPKAS